MAEVQCVVCGVAFPARSARSRFCNRTCEKRAQRAKRAANSGRGVTALGSVDGVFVATRCELEAGGALSTAMGQAALRLAARLDAGLDTGSALAAVAKQLGSSLEAALRGGSVVADPVDELRLRREARVRGA